MFKIKILPKISSVDILLVNKQIKTNIQGIEVNQDL